MRGRGDYAVGSEPCTFRSWCAVAAANVPTSAKSHPSVTLRWRRSCSLWLAGRPIRSLLRPIPVRRPPRPRSRRHPPRRPSSRLARARATGSASRGPLRRPCSTPTACTCSGRTVQARGGSRWLPQPARRPDLRVRERLRARTPESGHPAARRAPRVHCSGRRARLRYPAAVPLHETRAERPARRARVAGAGAHPRVRGRGALRAGLRGRWRVPVGVPAAPGPDTSLRRRKACELTGHAPARDGGQPEYSGDERGGYRRRGGGCWDSSRGSHPACEGARGPPVYRARSGDAGRRLPGRRGDPSLRRHAPLRDRPGRPRGRRGYLRFRGAEG